MRRRLKRALPETLVPAVGYLRNGGQAEIETACGPLGLELVEVARDAADAVERPGLARAFERLEAGDASCLIVGELTGLSGEVAELARLLDRIERGGVRLIALDVGLDTETPNGRLAVARGPERELPWAPPPPTPIPEVAPEEPPPAEPVPEEEPAAKEPEEPAAREPEASPAAPEPQAAPAAEAEPAPEPVVEEPAATAAPEPAPAPPAPAPPEPAPTVAAVRALGYASAPAASESSAEELDAQRRTIERGCKEHGFDLVELIGDREPNDGKALDRRGLSYAMQRIAAGDAGCLVVAGLDRLSRSVAELGTLVRWLEHNRVRLVAIDLGLDTATHGGRVTARALTSVGEWERERLSERTRTGLAAARAERYAAGGSTEPDWTALRKRIAAMRADGMTLQAIADMLNAEGVPTQRGGAKWRPSSVQSAAGYMRRTRSESLGDLPPITPPDA